MARTTIIDYTKRELAPRFKEAGPAIQAWATSTIFSMQESFATNYGDYDKAGDMEDEAYYAGAIDILKWMLEEFTTKPETDIGTDGEPYVRDDEVHHSTATHP